MPVHSAWEAGELPGSWPSARWGHGIPAEFVILIGQLCHAPVDDVVFHFLAALQLFLQFLELILQTLDFQLANLMADLKLLLSYFRNLLSQRLAFLTFRRICRNSCAICITCCSSWL